MTLKTPVEDKPKIITDMALSSLGKVNLCNKSGRDFESVDTKGRKYYDFCSHIKAVPKFLGVP